MDNNLDVNPSSTVPPNSINNKEKSTPREFTLRTIQNSTLDVTAERSGVVEMVMEMMIMIPMKSSLMTVTMASISPL